MSKFCQETSILLLRQKEDVESAIINHVPYSPLRLVLFNYRQAFDLIDHSILGSKLSSLDFPYRIASWIIDFLKCRKQSVKLDDCESEWKGVPAGVPQGTKLGP